MKYMYTNKPDDKCHAINGVQGRPVNTSAQADLKAKGWVFDPSQLAEVKKKELSIPEQAKALGIETEKDGKKIHYKLLAKEIEAHNGGNNER